MSIEWQTSTTAQENILIWSHVSFEIFVALAIYDSRQGFVAVRPWVEHAALKIFTATVCLRTRISAAKVLRAHCMQFNN